MTDFHPLTHLPIAEGDHITAMTVWEALGKQCIVVATKDQMFVLRIHPSGDMDWAGPLEFIESEPKKGGFKLLPRARWGMIE